MKIIDEALQMGRNALSEFESKQLLAKYGIPVTREIQVDNRNAFRQALQAIGYPLVIKACSPELAHKTEKGLIWTDIRNDDEALTAYDRIKTETEGDQYAVLVQEMIKGERELVAGMTRDPQFGPSVMFGLGGIFTEILEDVVFRVAPLEKQDALDMMREIQGTKILDAVRGMAPVDKDLLADILVAVGKIGFENPKVKEIDINPLIIAGSQPVAVDALFVLE